MTDERNFRSTYYEKVGCRSVEEKKSLNILLKDKPFNRIKLKQFCLSFSVPAAQRSLLWNIILGVWPVYPDSTKYVMEQRIAVYVDIFQAVNIMRYINDKTPKARVFYVMWLLETRKLHPDFNIYEETQFVDIAETLLQVFESDVEIYWITKEFFQFTNEIRSEFSKLKELTLNILEKEDTTIFTYLEKHNILNNLPLEKWYTGCFSGIISETALIRVWDKICGGSRKIVVFVLLVILKTLKINLMKCTNAQQIRELIEKKKEDQDDLIVNKAIELWQNNKSHSEFMVH
ncbi:TBC1 domain family member 7 [Condylostylus longicornis]|uniref:TBC1 domain family member 7 n=1 Tax=Condylostylus longicornis TaxID=2530218 RepID=UPI00244DD5EF|nr:TBC1 domain family member 7 [Condylostylus longicornis]